MSTSNISNLTEIPGDEPITIVTFDTERGPRTYVFLGSEAIAVASGADPQGMSGQEVDSPEEVIAVTGSLSAEAMAIIEDLL